MVRGTHAILVSAALLVGCTTRPVEKVPPAEVIEEHQPIPLTLEKDVDILFVLDNSNSMGQEQQNLARNFPKLIDALRTHKLGPDGSGRPCNEHDESGCKIPNVHIGVISTDLGAGSYGLPSCQTTGGDGGKLLSAPRVAGCTPPSDSYISYVEGTTNINGATQDPIQRVKEAFSCIAEIGTGGCGFEHTLEATRLALDGCGPPNHACRINPGFIRKDAFLAIVFITDEDDCSAQKPQLFDPNQQSLADPLGPLTSFRCFEFGIECNINDRTKPGPRQACKPAYDWLRKVDDYTTFFRSLKPMGRVIVSAISGPTDVVEVGMDAQTPILRPSCQTKDGHAVPAIRIKQVVDAFDNNGQFSPICTDDFGPALKRLGELILANIDTCLRYPPLTASGSIACSSGQEIGTNLAGAKVTCSEGCLERADCVVHEVRLDSQGQELAELVPRCPAERFADPSTSDCGAACPCWRLVPRTSCSKTGGYALDILRQGDPPKGATAVLKCQASALPWGSADFAELPQCE